jgi:hypothetical protein
MVRVLYILALLAAPAAHGSGSETFEADRFGLVLKRPAPPWTWSVPQPDPHGGVLGSINGNTGFELLARLTRDVKNDPTFTSVTLDCFRRAPTDNDATAYARKFADAMRPGDQNYQLLDGAKAINVGGKEGAVTELEVTLKHAEDDGSRTSYPAHVKAYFVGVGEYWVRLIMSTEKTKWPDLSGDLDKIPASAKWVPIVPPKVEDPPPSHDDPLEGLHF